MKNNLVRGFTDMNSHASDLNCCPVVHVGPKHCLGVVGKLNHLCIATAGDLPNLVRRISAEKIIPDIVEQ